MKRSLWAFALVVAAGTGCTYKSTVTVARKNIVLPAGTSLDLTLMKNLESGNTPEGSEVPLMVANDVLDAAGNVVVPRGQLALGKVRWSRGQDALDALSNRPPRLTITVDSTKTPSGETVLLTADPAGKPDEPYTFTRDNTGKQVDAKKLEALMKDPRTSQALEALARGFAEGDASKFADSPEAQEAIRKVAADLDLPETRQLVESHQIDKVQELMSQLRKGGAVAALASGGGTTALAAVTELAGVAGEVGSRLGGIVKGRRIKAYAGTRVTAKTTETITIRPTVPKE